MIRKCWLLAVLSLTLFACNTQRSQEEIAIFFENQLNDWNQKLTDVIIKDIFTPPVASRIYVYPNIAAYEVLASVSIDSNIKSLRGRLDGLPKLPKPQEQSVNTKIASIVAFSAVAKELIYSTDIIQQYEIDYLKECEQFGFEKQVIKASENYGKVIAKVILEWAAKDGYNETRTMKKYSLSDDPARWEPTPPDYMEGIEPNWMLIRTMTLDSASQFRPKAPTAFDSAKNSQFFKGAEVVYQISQELDEEKIEIAKFWDCNPNISYTQGHMKLYYQKLSPGGHWLSIASIITKQKKTPFSYRSQVFTYTSIALFDAFISCWDEKYRSNLTRPETFINRYIDPDWKPLLQTPAFPEHTSGHSVISASAAEMLTVLMGEDFAFSDTSEESFGLPTRSFESFKDAAEEAAISRLYGGIHYEPAIDHGLEQGRNVGRHVIDRLYTVNGFQADYLSKLYFATDQ